VVGDGLGEGEGFGFFGEGDGIGDGDGLGDGERRNHGEASCSALDAELGSAACAGFWAFMPATTAMAARSRTRPPTFSSVRSTRSPMRTTTAPSTPIESAAAATRCVTAPYISPSRMPTREAGHLGCPPLGGSLYP
jgi:hypothetical protein